MLQYLPQALPDNRADERLWLSMREYEIMGTKYES